MWWTERYHWLTMKGCGVSLQLTGIKCLSPQKIHNLTKLDTQTEGNTVHPDGSSVPLVAQSSTLTHATVDDILAWRQDLPGVRAPPATFRHVFPISSLISCTTSQSQLSRLCAEGLSKCEKPLQSKPANSWLVCDG